MVLDVKISIDMSTVSLTFLRLIPVAFEIMFIIK